MVGAAHLSGSVSGRGLHISGLSKRFGQDEVLRDVSLSVAPGEVLSLVGPSGAGKTTLCRIISGLEQPSEGSLAIDGREISKLEPGRRRIAFMFESYALYPHLTVRENIMSPLRARAGGRATADHIQAVDRLLTLLEVPHLADRQPVALSGGQKQRAALARALVQDPTMLLLDEPISHLDAKLRHKLRGEIRRMMSGRPHPSIWSTPDGLEALSVGDRVAVLHSGRIEQIGTPEDIWHRPASIKVAKLFGDPPTNILEGRIVCEGDAHFFFRSDLKIRLPGHLVAAVKQLSGDGVYLGIKPMSARVVAAGQGHEATVYAVEAFGKHSIASLRLGGGDIVKVKTREAADYRQGDAVAFHLDADDCLLFAGGTGKLIQA